jgi:hypothetical protein
LLLRLKRLHACDQWHSSRVFIAPLTGWRCKFRPNAEGNGRTGCNPNPNPNLTMGSVQTLKATTPGSCVHQCAMLVRWSFSTMDSAVLGLGSLGCGCCTLLVFEEDFALEDAIGSHACPLEALACVRPMAFLSGVHCLSPCALSMTSQR